MSIFPEALHKYADFTGRSRRKEYWLFVLFTVVSTLILMVVDNILGTVVRSSGSNDQIEILTTCFQLALIVPSLSVTARRLHDTDRSGWWQLIGLIPFLGIVVMLIFTLTEGDPAPNRFGPDPKALERQLA